MKRAILFLAALALLLGGVGQAEAGSIPISLTSSSFNEQVVVGSGLTVTATMDGGTGLGNYTYIQQGYNASAPANGLTSEYGDAAADGNVRATTRALRPTA